jgi:hypothetical protein
MIFIVSLTKPIIDYNALDASIESGGDGKFHFERTIEADSYEQARVTALAKYAESIGIEVEKVAAE